MSEKILGGTPRNLGRDPSKTAQAGGAATYAGRPEKERVWLALTRHPMTERETAQLARVSRWKVRNLKAGWLALGWLKPRQGGGVVVTDQAPKSLREGWAATPQGSPLHPPVPRVHNVGDATRVHRGKLKADLARSVDVATLDWWDSAKAAPNGVVYHHFVLPCKTTAGMVGVPVQVIQPKRLDRAFQVVVQSANIMAREAALVDLGRDGTLAWVLDAMTGLVRSWLRANADKLGPLQWTGLDREDLEVAIEAHPRARVGGDVQRDFVAVDKSDRYTPFAKEEEQTLTAFLRLRQLEADVTQLEGGQDRVAALLERLVPSVSEQMDGLTAAVEILATRGRA